MFQETYQQAMNKCVLSKEQKDRLAAGIRCTAEKKAGSTHPAPWVTGVSLAAITVMAVFCIFFPGKDSQPPLVITAYAVGESREAVPVQLTPGQKIQLYQATGYNGEGFAFDLSLAKGNHLTVNVTDADGTFPGNQQLLDKYGDFYWSLSEGNDISFIGASVEETYLAGYASGAYAPMEKGAKLVWTPNETGCNYVAIACYDEGFNRLCVYYLAIIQQADTYYAEITRIVQ